MKEDSKLLLEALLNRERNRYNTDNWNNILTRMIDKEASNHVGPREYDSIGRTNALLKLCSKINDLQNKMYFSKKYTITIKEL